ncbi:tRNA (guanine(6)-N(2))-methyltransferase THUMP3-like [Glandiceps talaboti]
MAAPTEGNVTAKSAEPASISHDTSISPVATVGATVPTGLEKLACDECKEKLSVEGRPGRGRMYFDLLHQDVPKLDSLRGVENLFVVVKELKDYGFMGEKEADMKSLISLVTEIDWLNALAFWKAYSHYEKNVAATVEECSKLEPSSMPTFRVTCHRVGKKHSFSSPEAACQFGGSINDNFKWRVDLSNADIEVLLNILDNDIQVGISLTRESMHRRNITHFGSTTLKATLAYMMMRLGEIQPGDVVCDPMCGTGAIPIEGSLCWSESFHLCGDIDEYPCSLSFKNIEAINERRMKQNSLPVKTDIVQWDICNLPLKTNSVDVFVTDLPFGKRSGSRMKNWDLYRNGMVEMARVCRENTGRAVLLTQDKKCMAKMISSLKHIWRNRRTLWINQGGLQSGIYLMHRTKNLLK